MRILGMALIILGIVAMVYHGVTYTTEEKILDIGPIQATAEKKKTIPLPPVVGGVLFAGGVVLMVAGARKPQGA